MRRPMFAPDKSLLTVENGLKLLTAAIYCALNIGLNDYNDWLFGTARDQLDLGTPLFYTCINFSLSAILWTPLLLLIEPNTREKTPLIRRYCGFLRWESFERHWFVLGALSLSISVFISDSGI